MSVSDSDSQNQIELICESFKEKWAVDLRPDFYIYLDQIGEPHRAQLLRRLLDIDVELRINSGQKVLPEDYASLGPDAISHVQSMKIDDFSATVDAQTTLSPNQEDSVLGTTVAPSLSESSPRNIGPYRLLEQIGEGGMGVVWLAQQEEPIRRQVALKLIRGDIGSRNAIARFESERQALAMMDHPNIAKVLDAGTTESGNPFFVMELVKGIPLTEYCDRNRLGIRDRMNLFVDVCNAVQHAHQKGIIHRDIKPSNVLVAISDGKPVPKVIDFGLAKAFEESSKLTDGEFFSEIGGVVGTFQYMAPEQAETDALGVDTRADIYSLGVVLYELLTGTTPIEKKTLRKAARKKVIELIKERVPPRPSTRLLESGDDISTITERRTVDTKKFEQILRGELDWIVMKALEKDRTRRYATANGFAADVLRYLNDEPVVARPPSATYRVSKFVKKHRALMATAATILALLIGITAVSTWSYFKIASQSREIETERDRALAQEKIANEKREEAEKQTRIAEEQTKLADDKSKAVREQAENGLKIIQDTITKVDEELAEDPDNNDLRFDIADSLIVYLNQIDPVVLDDEYSEAVPTLMAINQKLQVLSKDVGEFDKALELASKNYDLAKGRMDVRKFNDGSRLNMSRVCQAQAAIIRELERDLNKEREKLEEAVSWARDVVDNPKPEPNNPDTPQEFEIRSTLGAALQDLGAQRYRAGDLEGFKQNMTEAGSVFEKLLASYPESEEYKAEDEKKRAKNVESLIASLSQIRLALATYEFKSENFDVAFRLFDVIADEYDQKVAVDDPPPGDQLNFARMVGRIGFDKLKAAIHQQDQNATYLAGAKDQLIRTHKAAEALAQKYPKIAEVVFAHGLAEYRLGTLYEFLGEDELSDSHFQTSLEVREQAKKQADTARNNNMLMVSQARAGNWETAKNMADEKSAADPDRAQCVLLARVYALSAKVEGAPQKELEKLAIDRIKEALDKGFEDSFELRYEPDLATLQELDSFQSVLDKIKDRNSSTSD